MLEVRAELSDLPMVQDYHKFKQKIDWNILSNESGDMITTKILVSNSVDGLWLHLQEKWAASDMNAELQRRKRWINELSHFLSIMLNSINNFLKNCSSSRKVIWNILCEEDSNHWAHNWPIPFGKMSSPAKISLCC